MAAITCARCGRSAEAMTEPPLGGTLGARVQQNVCPDCWKDWTDQQMLFINHYGLQMADPEDRKRLYSALKEFLHLEP